MTEDTFTIEVINDETFPGLSLPRTRVDALMAETEENLTDLLPAGYRVRIRRWDHPDEPTQEDDDE